jgi:hypothetical protein
VVSYRCRYAHGSVDCSDSYEVMTIDRAVVEVEDDVGLLQARTLRVASSCTKVLVSLIIAKPIFDRESV